MDRSRVRLPPNVREPFTVYVNGVRQEAGRDFSVDGGHLVFNRSLHQERRLTTWQWLIGAFGIGTYGRDDQVDVAWDVDGAPRVAHALDITPPPEKT